MPGHTMSDLWRKRRRWDRFHLHVALTRRRKNETWETSESNAPFGNRGKLDRKVLSLFAILQSLLEFPFPSHELWVINSFFFVLSLVYEILFLRVVGIQTPPPSSSFWYINF